MISGFDVKKSEVHGMSQRGGVVTSHVRIGKKVYSPLIQQGDTNYLMAFEQAEGLRAISWLRKDGVAIVSRSSLVPAIVTSTKEFKYPDDAVAEMKKKIARVIDVDADKIAAELGNPRLVNTILLGVLSNYLPFAESLWRETIKSQVKPKLVDINLTALARGRQIKLDTVNA
jgi:indolepyruvate ferredoxin oxidoreductase, beta subunit